jgi:tetratricopeptide (TPR) repeat protein
VRANPALLASYRQRIELLRRAGRRDEAAATEPAEDRRGPAGPLLAATDLLAQGRVLKAENLCRRFLRGEPDHTEGMRLLAEIGVRLGALEEATFLLETACELEPDNPRCASSCCASSSKRQRFDRLPGRRRNACSRSAPDNLQFQSLRAIELLQLGRYDEAIAGSMRSSSACRAMRHPDLERPCPENLWTERTTAIASYRRAAEQREHGEAWYALANLKTYRFEEAPDRAHGAPRRRPGAGPHGSRVPVLCPRQGPRGPRGVRRGLRALRPRQRAAPPQLRYRADAVPREVDAQCSTVTRALLDRPGEGRRPGRRIPIFIVGMPRAGSTLVEQILAAHSQVEGTRELPNILALAQKLRRRRAAGERVARAIRTILADLDPAARRSSVRDYIEQTRIHRSGTLPRFIDKMPNNFRHIGLIHLILPNAKIIDARREPMACCFSNFQQLFAEGQEFSYDLGTSGTTTATTCASWPLGRGASGTRAPPAARGAPRRLRGRTARLLAYLELPFEDAACATGKATGPCARPPRSRCASRCSATPWIGGRITRPWLEPLVEALELTRGSQAAHEAR